MSENTNISILIGNLTRDIDLTYTNTGTAIGKLSIAVNERVKTGETWGEHANFIDVTIWGKRAESLTPYLLKGKKISVTGRLHQSRWEDKETGKIRSKIEVVANSIELLSPLNDQQHSNTSPSSPAQPVDDDIPF